MTGLVTRASNKYLLPVVITYTIQYTSLPVRVGILYLSEISRKFWGKRKAAIADSNRGEKRSQKVSYALLNLISCTPIAKERKRARIVASEKI